MDEWDCSADRAASESPDESALEFAAQLLKCPTAQCASVKCRRQTDKYGRGQVVTCDTCPKHVRTYLRCVQCKITIHVGCADSGGTPTYSWIANWKCSVCSKVAVPVLAADDVPVLAAVGASSAADATSSSAVQPTQLTSEDAATGASSCDVTYEDEESMHCALRGQGFRVKSTNYVVKGGTVTEHKASLYWQCPQCHVRFASRPVDGGGADDAWRVSVKPHEDGCKMCKMQDCQQDDHDAHANASTSSIFQHSWQLGSVKGLVDCIEEMGASGVAPNNLTTMGVHPSSPLTTTTVGAHPSLPCRSHSSGSNSRHHQIQVSGCVGFQRPYISNRPQSS